MNIIGIVAVDHNWAIGKKNGLLFRLPKDLQHFKELTSGHFVICGYNTLLSFPNSKPLPNRITICLAPKEVKRDDCIIVHTLEELFSTARTIGPEADFYVIGGGMLYESILPYYNKVLVTKVQAEDLEATVFFPNLDKDRRFKITEKTKLIKDGDYKIKFVTYERIK